jgi:superfamily I DNA and RNA helicase
MVTGFKTKLTELISHIHELISTRSDETHSKLVLEWVRNNIYDIVPAPLDFADLAVIDDKTLRELCSKLVKSLVSMSNFADRVMQDQNTNELASIEEKFRQELEEMSLAYARILMRLDQLKIELYP